MEAINQNEQRGENGPERIVIKEAVDFVFREHPELAEVGTREQYMSYIDGIFPESVFKEVVYHNSNAQFKNEGFKPKKPNFDTLNSIEGVYNFSSNRRFTERYGIHTYAVILDVRHPIEDRSTGEYVDDIDRPLSEALFKIGKQTENPIAPRYDESLKDTDAVINRISGDDYIEKHPRTGQEWGIPPQTVVSVFHEAQIHILGSQTDVQKFQEFVASEI
jgi:hypothetical protein